MSALFSPLTIRNITLKNRIVVSPMCQYSSVDGFANDWHLVHLGKFATGGSALVFTEAAAVNPEGRISPDDLGIWKDEQIVYLKKITDFIKKNGAIAGIQLAHAGRKASYSSPWKGHLYVAPQQGGWIPVAPSPIAQKSSQQTPKELTNDEIEEVITDFIEASKRAVKAGFDVIEIHGAHGYLINEFLSPLSNFRTDHYGGSFENRIRILTQIVSKMRTVIPEEMPLFVRLSATDWVEGGWNEDDTVALGKILEQMGVDLMDCSSGGNSVDQQIPLKPMYQVPYAQKVKEKTGLLTGAVGLITTAIQAENIIKEGRADLVFLARQLLREPFFPLHAAHQLGVDITWPVQYDRAKDY